MISFNKAILLNHLHRGTCKRCEYPPSTEHVSMTTQSEF
jgi:hypothetical protein